MSIPERFYRIARHKFSEIRDRVDRWDDEAHEADAAGLSKVESRVDASRELREAMTNPSPNRPDIAPKPLGSPSIRTHDEIRRGASPAPVAQSSPQHDPLLSHYRLLGVEPGTEFTEVYSAYNKLAARCDPARFPVNSQEAKEAERIRTRLEDSYKVLRDALDSTARRFDLLEFDPPAPK